jgi:histidyl-tRNA synthetase
MTKKRTYSDELRPNSSNSRKSSNGSITISIDSRSYSIDSNDEIKCGSFEEEKYSKKERKNSNPLLDFLMENNNKKQNIRRLREMKAYSKSPDEPKTIEQVQKMLYIFKNSKK